uniref:Uncharacterized protein n=1 Tax=Avena sativa TaxID=4498 RepID=A0ACD5UKU2_AVESA
MTGRNLGAARAKEEDKYVKSQMDTEMLCFLCMILVVTIGLSMFGRAGNAWSRYGSPALDVFVTVFYFTFVSIQMQVILAIVLASKPSPSRIPSPLNEWMMGFAVWLFLATYFLSYAMSLHAPEPSYADLIIAGIASAVNMAITVYSMLHRRMDV